MSQLRWLLAMAIGIIIMFAVWFDPDSRAQRGKKRVPRPPAAEVARARTVSPQQDDWESRWAVYTDARDTLIAHTPQGAVREAALDSLRQQYFEPDEIARAEILDGDLQDAETVRE